MSKFEEKKYKQTLIEDTPDLWDKINNQLSDDMFTTDSKPDMNMKPSSDASPRVNKKFKPSRIYKVAGVLAACAALVLIPIAISNSPDKINKTASSALDKATDNAINVAPDNESYDNNINNNKTEDTTNSAENNDNSNTLPETIVDNSTDEETTDNVESNTTQNAQNKNLKKGQIMIEITATYQIDTIGLVYAGTVKASNDNNIKPKTSICVSLKLLSKTDLGKQHDIGSNIIITLKDSSYGSSLNNPYYASSIS